MHRRNSSSFHGDFDDEENYILPLSPVRYTRTPRSSPPPAPKALKHKPYMRTIHIDDLPDGGAFLQDLVEFGDVAVDIPSDTDDDGEECGCGSELCRMYELSNGDSVLWFTQP